MDTSQITAVLITYNEEPNIARTLSAIAWVDRIVVIDSGSTDATLEILGSTPKVEVYHRTFDTMALQWNFGLSKVQTEWVLSLDADYRVSAELRDEIVALPEQPTDDGFMIPFRYCIAGKALRGSILPPRCALFRRSKSSYYDDGHTQRLRVDGSTGVLKSYLFHDDRKPLSRWLASQDRYMRLEAEKLLTTPACELNFADRLRRWIVVTPAVVPLHCLIAKGCILDGWHGVYYSWQRMLAEVLLALRLVEKMRKVENE